MRQSDRSSGIGDVLFAVRTIVLCAIVLLAIPGFGAQAESVGAPRPTDWANPIVGVPGLKNLYRVTPTLYRSAQPQNEGLSYIDAQRPLEPGGKSIKTVLSLRVLHQDSDKASSGSMVRYEQIFFKTWHPEDEDVIKLLRIVTTPALQPVLVHCHYGSDRTGTMIAIYRIAVQGWSKEAALLEMTQGGYGFHPMWKQLTYYVMNLDVDSLKSAAERQGPWQ